MFARFIHVVAWTSTSLLFGWLAFIPPYGQTIYYPFITWVDGCLGCFYFLAIMNITTMNIRVHVLDGHIFSGLLGIHLGLELLAHRVTLISAGTARLFYTTSQSHLRKLCFGLCWLKSVCRCWPFIWVLSPIWSDVSEEQADRIIGLNSAQPEKTCYGLWCLSCNKIQNRVQSWIWVLEAERDLAQGEQFRTVPILLCVSFGERLRRRFECKSFSWEVSPGNPL